MILVFRGLIINFLFSNVKIKKKIKLKAVQFTFEQTALQTVLTGLTFEK